MRVIVAITTLALLCSCSLLPSGKKKQVRHTYVIAPTAGVQQRYDAAVCGSIQVAPGLAQTGFRTSRMAYMHGPYELNYYAYSRWGDAPTRMLAEQLRRFLRDSGGFRSVLAAPVAVPTDFQLELADVKVVQKFDDDTSRLSIEFEGRLYDGARRQVLHVFRLTADENGGGDARSGVAAANQAAQSLLRQATDHVFRYCVGHDA